jgi:hypothetical protein
VAEEDALQDRVWRLVVEFRSSEWPIVIDLVLLSLRGVIMSQQYGAVNSWVAGESQMGDGIWCRLGAAQYLTGQWCCLLHLSQGGDVMVERQQELGPSKGGWR